MTQRRRCGTADATVWLGCLLNPEADAPLPDEAGIALLLDVANPHYLVPALYRALQERAGLSRLPEAALDYMQTMDAFALSRQQTIQQQLDALLDLLHGVSEQPPLLLKGAAMLAEGIYPTAHTRLMFDLDVLLSPEIIAPAVAALQGQGYRFAPGMSDWGLAEHLHHAPPLLPPSEGVVVELHRAALAKHTGTPLSNQELMAGAVPAAFAKASVPSATHQLWLAFVHTQFCHQHHRIHRFDLRHALDIVHLTRHHGDRIDWEWLQARATRHGYTAQLHAYFALIEHFIRFSVPVRHTDPPAAHYVRRVRHHMDHDSQLLNRLRLRLSDLKRKLSREEIEHRYGCCGSLLLQVNRLRYILHLLQRFSRLENWSKRRAYEKRQGL